ncbi:DegQ family serine endoprotease [Marivibrio halodurans]|uniref:Probable periplasmic serine endoprotease DegP-like n=2 Tax=Marivibrio halodurans TaxID=2039722 RepID=A0A8J7SNU6_9PROT|nr:DegQ family serine endoprotease [Marivibrio halodurans]MBP5857901.1 DegQ family serine endoprotease [Marivibrio halodurans]
MYRADKPIVQAFAQPRAGLDPVFARVAAVALALVMAVVSAAPAHARGTPDGFADLAEKLLPAVVNISTTQKIEGRSEGPGFKLPPGSPLEDFFERFGNPGGNSPPRQAQSLGSGFVVDAEAGIVITNNHVIEGADEIKVILQDDTELTAELLGTDPKTDVAVLSVGEGHELQEVPFGDSDGARIGDWVVAIGNPLGFGGTVTAGIVSARGRDINAGPYDNFIQTDAPINRGNSGGPLFNMDGQVIGINTAIISQTGGSIGIGFAVPSNQAEQVIKQIREYGTTRRGWLGVGIQEVSPDIADSLGLEEAAGALVANVYEKSPAERAGFKSGDVVLRFDGQKVPSQRALPRMVANTDVGKEVDVVVWRNGEEKTLKVTLGELEKVDLASLRTEDGEQGQGDGSAAVTVESLGLSLAEITGEVAQRLELDPNTKGVLVTDVEPNSDAAQKTLQPGDIILEVNQNPVTNPGEVAAEVQKSVDASRKTVLMRLERNGEQRFVAVKINQG